MKIIIIGAGQVGGTLAAHLMKEKSEITLVDCNLKVLQNLQERLDLAIVVGNGALPEVLKMAGAEDADLLIAATNSDEVNMVACQVAYTLFRIQTRIARVRAYEYLTEKDSLFNNDAIPINVLISPEMLVTTAISQLLEYPDASQVIEFGDGKAILLMARLREEDPGVACSLSAFHSALQDMEFSLLAVFRNDRALPLSPDLILEVDDEVYFIAARNHVHTVLSALRKVGPATKRVMIAGGGHIGAGLAEFLEKNSHYEIKLIERDPGQVDKLSTRLHRTLILQGDCADRTLLLEENIEQFDVFCSVTNHDEANIVSGLLAKRLGVRKTMVLVSQSSYVDIISGGEVDIAISPHLITMSGILSCIRRADVMKAHSLQNGSAEVMEMIAHSSSKITGKLIEGLELPPGTVIGALIRNERFLFALKDIPIEAGDHVIVFLADKSYVHDVERLFEVGMVFF